METEFCKPAIITPVAMIVVRKRRRRWEMVPSGQDASASMSGRQPRPCRTRCSRGPFPQGSCRRCWRWRSRPGLSPVAGVNPSAVPLLAELADAGLDRRSPWLGDTVGRIRRRCNRRPAAVPHPPAPLTFETVPRTHGYSPLPLFEYPLVVKSTRPSIRASMRGSAILRRGSRCLSRSASARESPTRNRSTRLAARSVDRS